MIHLINQYKLHLFYAIRNIYKHPFIKRCVRHGLKPLRIEKVPTDKLRIIRPVLCNEIDSNRIELFPWFDDYFKDDWSVKNSMLYKFLQDFYDRDISSPETRKRFKEHDYFQMHTYFRNFRSGSKPDDWIESKMVSFIKLAKDIERRGYAYSSLSNYIIVLKQPMCKTRYGIEFDEFKTGEYEVYTGHHRAASACFLGFDSLWVVVAEDVAITTPYGYPTNKLVSAL